MCHCAIGCIEVELFAVRHLSLRKLWVQRGKGIKEGRLETEQALEGVESRWEGREERVSTKAPICGVPK